MDDPGAAGMADELVDILQCQPHPSENLQQRGFEILSDEFGNGAADDYAKALGVDAPAHDVERIGPKVFAGMLDLRRAAVAGAQDDRGGAVTEQADGDDVGL